MSKNKFLISLCTNDNDYQCEQAIDAEQASRRLGVDIEIVYAKNDSIYQTQQLLESIQSRTSKPDAILFEPVGATSLPLVARAACQAGVGWVVLNREAEYLMEFRRAFKVPAFCVTTDHEEVGRIQGHQMAALLPNGGNVLYIQGPSDSAAAKQRTKGMNETRPQNIQVRMLRGQWTLDSAKHAVQSWLQLATSHDGKIDAIVCQDDSMALGAHKAFSELLDMRERDRWLSLPFAGCDGLRTTGQKWVLEGLLAATVVIPPNTGTALTKLVEAIRTNTQPQINTSTKVSSFPHLETLGMKIGQKTNSTTRIATGVPRTL